MLSFRFNALIVLFWLSTMSWLLVAKVLPPIFLGERPTLGKILQFDEEVAWDIYSDQKLVGSAVSSVEPGEDGVKELRSEVRFTELPLENVSPLRLGAFISMPNGQPQRISLVATAAFEVDPLGRLLGFDSKLETKILPDIHVHGVVEDSQLRLVLRSGTFVYRTESFLPRDSLLTDALSPQAHLPGLKEGQSWLVPLYSPFNPRTDPLESLEAVVEGEEPLAWQGKIENTQLVVYYNEQGGRLKAKKQPRGKLWVRRSDGAVLQQEVPMMNAVLRFVRRPLVTKSEPEGVPPKSGSAASAGAPSA